MNNGPKELPLVKKTGRWTIIFIIDVRHAQERKFSSLSSMSVEGPMLLKTHPHHAGASLGLLC